MEAVKAIIDALYREFLLRDLFAKVVPGGLVLLALGYRSDAPLLLELLREEVSVALVLFLTGAAWIAGFGVQGLGEATHLIRHWPDRYKEVHDRYRLRLEFKARATEDQKRRAERYALIKEAAGNGAAAILLACAIVAARWMIAEEGAPGGELVLRFVSSLVLAAGLVYTNRTHRDKHYDYIEKVACREGER